MKRIAPTLVAAALSVGICVSAAATQLVPTEIDDPFADAQCDASEVMSYGSYIYSWPSKYDGVYWPFTDELWIWLCESSGYLSFGSDFDSLSDVDRERISEFLTSAPPVDFSSLDQRLDRLAEIYKIGRAHV